MTPSEQCYLKPPMWAIIFHTYLANIHNRQILNSKLLNVYYKQARFVWCLEKKSKQMDVEVVILVKVVSDTCCDLEWWIMKPMVKCKSCSSLSFHLCRWVLTQGYFLQEYETLFWQNKLNELVPFFRGVNTVWLYKATALPLVVRSKVEGESALPIWWLPLLGTF